MIAQLRMFRGLFTHIRRGVRFDSTTGPRSLFQPLIIFSYSPLLECDYNLHKSNSTYFSDLDISRTHLITALCGRGIGQVRGEKDVKANGRFSVMLGGVSCVFRREIKPYQRYEIWSRILCWDRKWVYIISHFVKKGYAKSKAYTLQPRKATTTVRGPAETKPASGTQRQPTDSPSNATNPAIFASGISKYVFKAGRFTIPPERILEAAGLLPPRPSGHRTPPATPSPETANGTLLDTHASSILQNVAAGSLDERIDASLLAKRDDEVWDWAKVEDERLRGLKIVELMAGLDLLQDEFMPEKGPILGEF